MITDFSYEYLISQLKIFEFPYFIPTFTDNLIFLKFILIYFVNELLSSLDFRMNTDAKAAQ
jgi:hypothetical protein